jgi:hypothetical protein
MDASLSGSLATAPATMSSRWRSATVSTPGATGKRSQGSSLKPWSRRSGYHDTEHNSQRPPDGRRELSFRLIVGSASDLKQRWIRMRRFAGITVGLMIGVAGYATPTTGAQQAPRLTCNPTSVPSMGGGVWVSCAIENFPTNTPITVTEPFALNPRQLTTDDAAQARFTFVIPEFGVCTQRSGLTVAASGGGAEASMTIVVTPVPQPVYCGPVGAVPAQPRLTG